MVFTELPKFISDGDRVESLDFEVTNKFGQAGEFAHMESMNNQDELCILKNFSGN